MLNIQEICVGGVVLNEKGEILFVKRADDDDFLPRFWEMPGGTSDFGEEPEETLKREIKEECGLEIEVGNPLAVQSYIVKKEEVNKHCVEILFLCKRLDMSEEVKMSFEHSDFKFLLISRAGELELSDYMAKFIKEIEVKI